MERLYDRPSYALMKHSPAAISIYSMNKDKVIKLCCGGKGCPTIQKKNNKEVVITDESGAQVTISIEEAELIHKALKEL